MPRESASCPLDDVDLTLFCGRMIIGGVNETLFDGDINWNPLQSKGYWQIQLGGVSVNGIPVELKHEPVAIDTGTSLIGVPEPAAEAIYARIPGSRRHTEQFYTFPCE